MNINCIICADLFSPSAEIYTTRCGHLFHYLCVTTWLERSKTCPQCRQKCNDKLINRVYFNFPNTEGVTDDVVSLQSKLDALTLNLRMKDVDFKVLEDKYKIINEEHERLINEAAEKKVEIDKLKSGIGALKEQLLYVKVKIKENEKLEQELSVLKQKTDNLEHLNKGITGSYEDAQNVARDCQDVKTLSQIVLSLKIEVQKLLKTKEKMFLQLKRSERELHASKKELDECIKINTALSYANQVHEKCDLEKRALKKKIDELTKLLNDKIEPQIEKVSEETQQNKPKFNLNFSLDATDKSFIVIDSPDIATRAKQIKDSDSPYLKIKSNSMGMLLQSQGLSSRLGNTENTSIFKSKRTEPKEKPTVMPDHISHDGMGGHERNIGLFSNRLTFTQSLKRQKSTSSLPSNKFKKLSKQQTNKIDDYINLSELA